MANESIQRRTAFSEGSNYFKIGNCLIQWGTVAVAGGVTSYDLTLPQSYASQAHFIGIAQDSSGNGRAAIIAPRSGNTIRFYVASGSGNASISWLTIGTV